MGAARKARIQREATRLLEAGVAGRVFPGGSVGVAYREGEGWQEVIAAAGQLSRGAQRVRPDTLYDLGALTRPFVAATASRLLQRDEMDPRATLHDLLSDLRGGPAAGVRFGDLLTCRAGIAAWGGLYLDVPYEHGSAAARRWLVAEAGRRFDPKLVGREEHGDLGYLLLGECMVRSRRRGLEALVAEEVTQPLGVADEVLYLAGLSTSRRQALSSRVAPTERCHWRGEIIHAAVHDENAAAFGGVAGHAGLFATAHGVLALGRALVDLRAERDTPWGASAPVDDPHTGRPLGFSRALAGGQQGRRLGDSFGELALVGTSLCCDESRELVVALLTNRIHPSRANAKILGFRPAFHDAIAAAYDG